MRTVANRQFSDERVRLDGTNFVGCTFHRCALLYGGGQYWCFDDCVLEECRLKFDGAAKTTLDLLQRLYTSDNASSQAWGVWAVDYIRGGTESP